MKPIIVYTDVKDGYVTMTKEMFEKYISEAYQAGKEDSQVTCTIKPYDPYNASRINPYRCITPYLKQ